MKRRRPLLVASRFVSLVVASILLYYGLGILFLVPGNTGGPYWAKERVVYGIVPLSLGLLSIGTSAWSATRYRYQSNLGDAITQTLLYAAVGIVAVFATLVVNDRYIHLPIHFR
ncbi:MAG: hypothetical protein ABSE57_23855 [Bryobacteraceae bacterium]|jgi:uncharacterized membrane protein